MSQRKPGSQSSPAQRRSLREPECKEHPGNCETLLPVNGIWGHPRAMGHHVHTGGPWLCGWECGVVGNTWGWGLRLAGALPEEPGWCKGPEGGRAQGLRGRGGHPQHRECWLQPSLPSKAAARRELPVGPRPRGEVAAWGRSSHLLGQPFGGSEKVSGLGPKPGHAPLPERPPPHNCPRSWPSYLSSERRPRNGGSVSTPPRAVAGRQAPEPPVLAPHRLLSASEAVSAIILTSPHFAGGLEIKPVCGLCVLRTRLPPPRL